MSTDNQSTDSLAQAVFGDPESEWHGTREALEIASLRAAAELMGHTQASWVQFEGFGVNLTIELTGDRS